MEIHQNAKSSYQGQIEWMFLFFTLKTLQIIPTMGSYLKEIREKHTML